MNTPICDFVASYAQQTPLRLHMPGHKGQKRLGIEHLDITEVDGADSLFHASGIIRESEENATSLFGCKTFYATEGSSMCIRAMLYLCCLYARSLGQRPLIAAARNVHTSFVTAATLLDFDLQWIYGAQNDSYLSCKITAEDLDDLLHTASVKPTAVYVTSPDYLGNMSDIHALSEVCHRHGVLLAVDNAHGAYLHFLPSPADPVSQGADICCDSAHKTLPVLTGGAYLHIGTAAPELFVSEARRALALFGSTSPSYLILQSLDTANVYLEGSFTEELRQFLPIIEKNKALLRERGYTFLGDEPMKWTIACKSYGYTGFQMADQLTLRGIIPEFSDPDYLVLMLSPQLQYSGLVRLCKAMLDIPKRDPIHTQSGPLPEHGIYVCSPKDAAFSRSEKLPVALCEGRILASPSVGCPPAVPIVVCGERISKNAIRCFPQLKKLFE